jgi:hypothetical protein
LPARLSGKLLCDVPGTTTGARLSPHTKMATQIILKADGFGLHIAVGNLPGYFDSTLFGGLNSVLTATSVP